MSLRYCKTFAVAMDVGTPVCRILSFYPFLLLGKRNMRERNGTHIFHSFDPFPYKPIFLFLQN